VRQFIFFDGNEMSKGKAKTASKNNPTTRERAKKVSFNGRDIKPVEIITDCSRFLGAEYEDNGDLVTDQSGVLMTWKKAVSAA
jgi:hypothetical protein